MFFILKKFVYKILNDTAGRHNCWEPYTFIEVCTAPLFHTFEAYFVYLSALC